MLIAMDTVDVDISPLTQATEMPPGSPSLNLMRNVPFGLCSSIFSASVLCMKPWIDLREEGGGGEEEEEGEGRENIQCNVLYAVKSI